MRHPLTILMLCAGLLGWAGPVAAQKTQPAARFEARVVRVIDGASFVVRLADKTEQTVRLRHIDAPEPCQAGGAEATQSLVDLALGKNVQISGTGRTTSGALLATVMLDELDLSRRQVAEGQAWSQRYRYDTGPLVKEERMARALRRGLHATGQAEMPKDFRKRQGPCMGTESLNLAPPAPPSTSTSPSPTPAVPNAVSAFRCDGRTHCSQMRSCAEARYFLKNCPATEMDGDKDGVPCETQWCR